MFKQPDSSRSRKPKISETAEKHFLSVLANPTASESDWIEASEALGDIRPRKKRFTRNTAVLALMGILGIAAVSGGLVVSQNLSHRLAPSLIPAPHAGETIGANKESKTNIDYGPYIAKVQKAIKRAWYPPKGNESTKIVVQFKVDPEGHVSKVRLISPTELSAAAQRALVAVRNAEIDPLPTGATEPVDIQFTFAYNVFDHNHSRFRSPTRGDEAGTDHFYSRGTSDAFSSGSGTVPADPRDSFDTAYNREHPPRSYTPQAGVWNNH